MFYLLLLTHKYASEFGLNYLKYLENKAMTAKAMMSKVNGTQTMKIHSVLKKKWLNIQGFIFVFCFWFYAEKFSIPLPEGKWTVRGSDQSLQNPL